ncbi:G-protein coupled receptor moody isoform X2 [Culicoides brevitarsis]|uniref:G-protein coupled receptor moody isoform X2 n=1 Tax=Culicoides brevitarsis TaxID=469753 RepID=UPI00307C3273
MDSNEIMQFGEVTTRDSISQVITKALVGATEITDFDDPGELSKFSRSLLTFAAVATILIMLVGIFGNLLTIFALVKCPKVRNVAAAFIISLCVADCLFCLVVLPFNALRFIRGTFDHGDILCIAIPFLQYGNVGVSLLCIASITLNRYIMIAHHSIYSRIYKKHWISCMIIFCWLFSYGFQLPTLFKVWGRFGYDEKLGTCTIVPDENGRSSKTALFFIAFITPCIIIIACYARIFWVVHESEKRMRQHSKNQNAVPNNLRSPAQASPNLPSVSSGAGSSNGKGGAFPKATRIKDQREVKQKRNEWRITKMVLAIFLSFLICYLPITIIKIFDKDVNSPALHIIGYILIYLSACINPIIYVIMNKQYRQAYKTVLLCKPPRLLSFRGSSANDSPHPGHLPVIPDNKEMSY